MGGFDGWRGRLALAFALVAAQAALWLNPGYFSHDELQWGARAAVEHWRDLPFESFSDWQRFQFRPLTFNLWLLLSHALFDTPRLFHAVFVALGAFNALLLAGVLRGAGCRSAVALGAALAFGLSPFATWVHGWVGCLADLLWVGVLLLALRGMQVLSPPRRDASDRRWLAPESIARIAAAAGLGAGATALGLLTKEAALSIPALLGLYALALRLPRAWLASTLASGAVAVVYLALRLDVLTSSPAEATYAIKATAIPANWLAYQVFPWALGPSEIHVLSLASTARWAALVMLLAAFALCLWRASPRLWLAWLAGGTLALAPALALPVPSNQYGYAFMAVLCGTVAMAWRRMGRIEARIMLVLALLVAVHGVQIQRHLLQAGKLQAVFSPSLAEAARAQPEGALRLWPDAEEQRFVYSRLSHDIASYRGTPLGARVQMATSHEAATHRITSSGRVRTMSKSP
jgi:hypothetical protein